ncbi:hypothetical protein TWF569_007254 [Orbilia oligospora]|uniref:Thioesterase domain-containing protein n=4 Tax=Orbilia oligospora TaxID=2813651 RepID=A0A7C8JRL6_ORBOL|nr:hypothetical protein TWF706_010503 [Orbilia oligospora]KAF3090179.1 hypothetical protein TWF102_009396 [Orbilia oligospora]KAF3094383.1 hypothetical protein TWF103_010579 [Orbilia oligospora]KAF3129485.1 hypothetical protein TWF594_010951 [Orbilia oligospora]KAF3136702.1 hypothetical protein TWF703_005416 [Orbilia oligospora]
MDHIPTFLEASAVKQLTSHTYSGNLSKSYCIGAVPNGGYVAAVMLRAAATHMTTTHARITPPQKHAISFHGMFMIKTNAGAVEVKVADSKIGRGYSVLHIELLQEGMKCVNAYVTMTNIDNESGPTLNTFWEKPDPGLVGRKQLDKLLTPEGVEGWYEHPKPFADFREVSKRTRFFSAKKPTPGVVSNWGTFTNQSDSITNEAIALIADLFVGVVEQMDSDGGDDPKQQFQSAKFWYPTLSFTLDVKKSLPKDGVKWVFSKVHSQQVKNGRWDLQVVMLDEDGELLATSTQVALMVDASRNTKPRGKRDAPATKL